MFAQFKYITLTLLILAIGLGQPLAASLDISNVTAIEVSDEKEIEINESEELFNSRGKRTVIEPHYRDYDKELASYTPTCHPQSAFVSKQHHTFYLLYDTWLV